MAQFNTPLFGLNIDPSASRLQLAYDLARLADESGYDFISIQDHPYNPAFLDTWTLQTALGVRTQRVRLITNVTNLPLHPPAMLAKVAASLDILTNGRLEVGLGAGATMGGAISFGAPQRSAGEAVSALEEAIALMRTFWQQAGSDQPVTFTGKYYQLLDARPGPAPVHPIGIWLGALHSRMLRLTGREADGLLISSPYVPPEDVLTVQQTIDEAAQEAGRDPLAIRRGYNLMGTIRRAGDRPMTARRKGVIIGTVEQWVDELLRYYHELRLDTFIFWPLMGEEEWQARVFVEEVVMGVREKLQAR